LGESAIAVTQAGSVDQLPGYTEGWWSVQDLGAQRAATLLAPKSGERVLDACAAPGGKTAHLLELAPITLTALDQDPDRLARVGDTLSRLRLIHSGVTLKAVDARNLEQWWDGKPFDAILADLPCTASGVVRRHPDIAWLRRVADLPKTVTQQAKIFDALWQTLAPGGRLLMVTCSVFLQEGEQQALNFLSRHTDARRLPAPGHLLPKASLGDEPGQDGFFYGLFERAVS
jgi:16S rRNA (cytosine967-C5)-methyltransferase